MTIKNQKIKNNNLILIKNKKGNSLVNPIFISRTIVFLWQYVTERTENIKNNNFIFVENTHVNFLGTTVFLRQLWL